VTETDSTAAYGAQRHPDPAQTIESVEAQQGHAGGQTKLVDIRDMLVLHAALLREFRLAPAAVGRVKPGDRKHAQDVDDYLALICEMLHEHHVGEDTILWPPLRARVSADDHRLLDKAEAQHEDINAALGRVNDARRRWSDRPDQDHGSALTNELQTLYALVNEHLADEERDIVPLAAAYLSESEWRAINNEGPKVLSPKTLLICAGMCCYGTNRELVALVLQVLPPPVRLVVPVIARRKYARLALRVHGTRRP
jgi:hemerythrin-like domain-containing protein